MKRTLMQLISLAFVLALVAPAWGIDPYPITMEDVNKVKKMLNDPRPQITGSDNLKAWIPDDVWQSLVYDEEEMKKLWSEIVGFKAPDVVGKLELHGLELETPAGEILGEGPMNAEAGERFVVEQTGRVYPGLYVAGMAVCAVFGGARMGPIFGGMLLSGEKVAEQVTAELGG